MIGQLLLLGVEGPELSAGEIALFQKLQPAGYILFSRNLVTPRQTRALTDSLRALHPLEPIVAIDQEGGRVTRTTRFAPPLPSAVDLAAQGHPATIAKAACLTADQLRLLGFNLDFAPVLDLDHHPEHQNALRERCWGRDPQRVIDHAGMWNHWLRKRMVRSCAKHFPACGRALADPHYDLPVSHATKTELLAEDIIPYTALMPELDSIMLAHVLFPAIDPERPASLSPRIVRDLLRNQLGFDHHLVLTDDLDMAAIADRFPENSDVTAAIAAGNDIAMICHRQERAADAAAKIGALPGHLTHDALIRVGRFRENLHPPTVWSEENWTRNSDDIAALAATVPTTAVTRAASPVTGY